MKSVVIRRGAVEACLGGERSLSNTVTSPATRGRGEAHSQSDCVRSSKQAQGWKILLFIRMSLLGRNLRSAVEPSAERVFRVKT
jgi:hypothetical protein